MPHLTTLQLSTTLKKLALSSGAALVGFLQAGTGALGRTVQSKMRDNVSVLDFIPESEHAAIKAGTSGYDCRPAFQAAHDSLSAANNHIGGEIIIPSGAYYLGSTWHIKKRVTIRGTNAGDQPETAACILKFPADVDGIRFWSSIDSDTGTNATQSCLFGVEVKALAKNVSGVGIKCTTTVRIEYCIVRDFKSHGIEFHGQTGTGATGICDFWKVSNTRIVTNGGHGLYTHGNDSQVGVASQVECVANGGHGFYDVSAYGNTYIACQAAGNEAGSYFNQSSTTYFGSTFLGCYVEFGTSANATLKADSIVIGGVLGAVAGDATALKCFYPGGSGINVPASGRHMWFRNLKEIARIETDNMLHGLRGYTCTDGAGNHMEGNTNTFSMTTTVADEQDRFRFNNPNGRVGSITTNGSATAYNTSSDYRLKNVTKKLTGSGAFIDALRPVAGTWKADGAPFVGFLAHEVQAVSPSSVSGVKDAMVDIGNVLNEAGELVSAGVEQPPNIPEGWQWVFVEAVPKMQVMEYGSAEFIANIVSELQSLRKRLAAAGL